MTKNRTEVADLDRSLYDFTYGEEGFERLDAGITPDIVREISAKKDEPQWMLDLRLKSLEIFNRFPDPTGGPSIEGLDMDNIVTYVKPNTDQKHDWESVPDDIKNTFERLGIPEAERSYLAGVGAQYDSELVYHNMQDTASKMGIVYSGIEEALHGPYADLIRERFMKLDELPFDFVRRRVSVLVEDTASKERCLICKGAVEEMLSICTHLQEGASLVPLTPERAQGLLEQTQAFNKQGFRVLIVARKRLSDHGKMSTTMSAVSRSKAFSLSSIRPKRAHAKPYWRCANTA